MNKKTLKEIYGYDLDKTSKIELIKEVKESGRSIEEVIAEGKILPILPQIFTLDDDCKIEYQNKKMTVDEFERVNPLGSHARIILISTQKIMDKYHKLKDGTDTN